MEKLPQEGVLDEMFRLQDLKFKLQGGINDAKSNNNLKLAEELSKKLEEVDLELNRKFGPWIK